MHDPLFSQQWYRVQHLTPRVRSDALSSRHLYRGQTWYVLRGPGGGDGVRINASAFHVMSEFDGARSVGDIWDLALVELGDDAPTQGEMIELASDLFEAGVLDFEHTSDIDQLFDNKRTSEKAEKSSRYRNPLFVRISLFSPNRLAAALQPVAGWIFTRKILVLWFTAMALSLVAVGYSWDELSRSVATDLPTRRSLVILWFVFPIMKLLHELAHAVAVRRFGGEVHDCGIALLVLLPVPYVDASDSGLFSNKYHRMAVAAAGVFVETGLACLGLAVWMTVEPGLVRDIALNVFITGTVSSLLFNGNPLLKFDAYYVLADAIEIPNLASRASRYPVYLMQRYLLRMDVHSPAIAPGERRWLLGYGLTAAIYRIFLSVAICLYVATHFFFIGVALAVWAVIIQLGKPLWRLINFLLFDKRIVDQRLWANSLAVGVVGLIGVMLFVVPVPHVTAVRGVVWPVDQAVVRTGVDCFVDAVLTENGDNVQAQAPLLTCSDQQRDAVVAGLRADHIIARAALDASRDRVERQLYRTELKKTAELLSKAEERDRRSEVISEVSGEVYFPGASSLVGRYLEQGTVVGYVLNKDKISIRTMLAQERVELLEQKLETVDVRLLRGSGSTQTTSILRRVPAASEQLHIAALGENGGGDLQLMPAGQDGKGGSQLRNPAFEIELALPDLFADSLIGEPVELRFTHGSASAATILYRKMQLLLLSKFHV
ncbi:MAG: hypothetical protein AB8G18_08195 [Gammaproteobacteria bacterium]